MLDEFAMKIKKKPTPPQTKHQGHKWIVERGQWGPHTARYICLDCKGEHIQWISTKPRQAL